MVKAWKSLISKGCSNNNFNRCKCSLSRLAFLNKASGNSPMGCPSNPLDFSPSSSSSSSSHILMAMHREVLLQIRNLNFNHSRLDLGNLDRTKVVSIRCYPLHCNLKEPALLRNRTASVQSSHSRQDINNPNKRDFSSLSRRDSSRKRLASNRNFNLKPQGLDSPLSRTDSSPSSLRLYPPCHNSKRQHRYNLRRPDQLLTSDLEHSQRSSRPSPLAGEPTWHQPVSFESQIDLL